MSYPQNNNPGDIRYDGTAWNGLADPPQDEDGFCCFLTLVDGVRALAKDIVNQKRLHGITTLTAFVDKFAPPSENDTAAYIANLAEWTGWAPDQTIDLEDYATVRTLLPLVIRQERGVAIDPAVIDQGVTEAFQSMGLAV